jgi:hypothetical protein
MWPTCRCWPRAAATSVTTSSTSNSWLGPYLAAQPKLLPAPPPAITYTLLFDTPDASQAAVVVHTGESLLLGGLPDGSLPLVQSPAGSAQPTFNVPAGSSGSSPPATYNLTFQVAGNAAPPGVPVTLSGGFMAVDGTTSPAYASATSSGSAPSTAQQFLMYPLDGGPQQVQPGEQMLVKSVATGMYCRLAQQGGGAQVVMCDLPTSSGATPFFYSSAGLGSGSTVLAPTGPGGILQHQPVHRCSQEDPPGRLARARRLHRAAAHHRPRH